MGPFFVVIPNEVDEDDVTPVGGYRYTGPVSGQPHSAVDLSPVVVAFPVDGTKNGQLATLRQTHYVTVTLKRQVGK